MKPQHKYQKRHPGPADFVKDHCTVCEYFQASLETLYSVFCEAGGLLNENEMEAALIDLGYTVGKDEKGAKWVLGLAVRGGPLYRVADDGRLVRADSADGRTLPPACTPDTNGR